MNNLDRWLAGIAATPLFILFSEVLEVPASVSNVLLLVVLVIPFFVVGVFKRRYHNFGKYSFVILLSLVLVIFNILLSEDIKLSLQYWIVYLVFTYGFYIWWCEIDSSENRTSIILRLTSRVGVYVGISALVILILLMALEINDLKTFNSLGIISGSAICYLWFVKGIKTRFKWLLIAFLAVALFISLSRSSLVFTILTIFMVEILLSNQGKIRKAFIVFSGLIFVFFFSGSLLDWLSQKELSGITSFSQIQNLNDDRSRLIENFMETYDDNFFTGYGINVSYQELSSWDIVDNLHVHNGILDTVLQVGIPLAIVFIVFYLLALKRSYHLARNNSSFAAIFGFLTYYAFRSYGESYFMLNIGNPMSISVIILVLFVLNLKNEK
ncbi:hypothetical protein CW736_09255 [Nonlabens sp. MB-3u-79]|uniref:O-antigen ligase family protein n=1 Tax=Nonlabens sp. MB-3u-79 TaxID=2058134 RepID=UPI000C308419|nr:O-antigen ligase family protein [Nonlabens sp. MB-3u-79]AUC79544.1 hypothetical protein CW736_09255 [Nonlabens sp. MB-3u-79]